MSQITQNVGLKELFKLQTNSIGQEKQTFVIEMVFYYQNCEKKLMKFEDESREFAKSLRSLEQFLQTVKGQNNFW